MSTFLLGHYKKLFYLDKYYTLRKKVVVWRPWSVFFCPQWAFWMQKKRFPPQKRFFRATWNSVTWTSLETVNIICGLPLSFCPWPEFLVYCICMLFLVSVQKIIFCIYCGLFLPSRDLLAQSQQWAQENNLWNLFKANNKDTTKMTLMSFGVYY